MTTPPESGPTLDAASPLPPDIEAADEPTKVPLAIEDWLTVLIMGALALITFANVLVTSLTPAERDAFVKATRPVYDKWKSTVGADLVAKAEQAIAARKK